jgi:hypothetical protein
MISEISFIGGKNCRLNAAGGDYETAEAKRKPL